MATYGVGIQNSSAQVLLDSRAMNGVFYNSNGTFLNTSSIPTSGFTTQYAIATPISPSSYVFFNVNNVPNIVNIAGTVNANGTIFYQPSALETGGNCLQITPTVNPVSTHVYTFGTPPSPTGYGFSALGSSNNNYSISANTKSYYLQPAADGNFIRTATCTSLPSSFGSSVGSYTQPTGNLSQPNITFEKSFINPPLIFVTQSSGPIAFNYMTTDSNGRYNGASIVAGSSFSTQGLAGTAPYTANTYTFSYFLVSDEEPFYGTQANYGMKVWNSSGIKIFDSSYFVPNFQAFTVDKPWMWLTGSWPTSNGCSYTGSVNYFSNQISFTKSSNFGVLLNNLYAITGQLQYVSLFLGSQGSSSGPTTFYGRFATVTDTSVVIAGTGANAVFSNPLAQYPGWGYSYDFSRGNTSTMSVVFANYVY